VFDTQNRIVCVSESIFFSSNKFISRHFNEKWIYIAGAASSPLSCGSEVYFFFVKPHHQATLPECYRREVVMVVTG
jgi:hypothetical protein